MAGDAGTRGPGEAGRALRSERLPRGRRIARRTDFLAVQTHGRKLSSVHYLLFARARPAGESRIGVTVSRKIGNAVTRNRVKRWIRESYRTMAGDLPAGLDLVVVARPSAAEAGFVATTHELRQLARRVGSL